MINTKVLRELFNQIPQNNKVYEIVKGSTLTESATPLLALLRMLNTRDFSIFATSLRPCDLDKCDHYATRLTRLPKFWSGDSDAVRRGILAIIETSPNTVGEYNSPPNVQLEEEAEVVFELFITVAICGSHKELNDLFYNSTFINMLDFLKKYTLTLQSGVIISYYEYVDKLLKTNASKYATMMNPKEEVVSNALDSFIGRVLESGKCHNTLLHCVTDVEFKSVLLKYIVNRSLTEDNDYYLARMYGILLIFYTTEEIRNAYRSHSSYTPQGTIMRNCMTDEPMNPYTATMLTTTWSIVKLIKMWITTNKEHLLLSAIDQNNEIIRTTNGFDNGVLSSIWNFCNTHISC